MDLWCLGSEVADDCARVANGDLDVGLEFDACAGEGRFAFLEDAAHGLERASDGFAEAGNGGVENEAIAVAFEPVEVASAGGFGDCSPGIDFHKRWLKMGNEMSPLCRR